MPQPEIPGHAQFWEQPEQVERFASRPPDERLLSLLERIAEPADTRVLDLGCAGGRNTAVLAERGFDVFALDASPAMTEHTRRRVAAVLGAEEARRRVRLARMDELDHFPDSHFDLVLAVGILHEARSGTEWHRTLGQLRRVLRPGGRLLVANFAPGTDITGGGTCPVPGEPHVFESPGGLRHTMLTPEQLDEEMRRHDLLPVAPTRAVEVRLERGQRTTVNALYEKATGARTSTSVRPEGQAAPGGSDAGVDRSRPVRRGRPPAP